jgi:hypothetical protein
MYIHRLLNHKMVMAAAVVWGLEKDSEMERGMVKEMVKAMDSDLGQAMDSETDYREAMVMGWYCQKEMEMANQKKDCLEGLREL